MKKLLIGAIAGVALTWAITGWMASSSAPGGDIRIALECRGIEKKPFRNEITVEQYEADAAKRNVAWDEAPDITDATGGVNRYFDHATISVEKGRVVAAEADLWNGVIYLATPTRIEFEARKWDWAPKRDLDNTPDVPKRVGVIDRTTGDVDIHDIPITYKSADAYKNSTEVAFDFRCHPAATKF
jgi:hypothetical protein